MKGKASLFALLISFILYFMDIISDIYVAFQYYKNGEIWWFAITLFFVIVPHVIINTYATYINVNFLWVSSRKSFLMWIFQISVLASFKQEFNRWKREHWKNNGNTRNEQHSVNVNKLEMHSSRNEHSADVTLTMHHTFLCLTEAFAESAPQCCLQNYIMMRQWRFPWYTVLSTVLSLFSLAWSIASLETSCKTCQWTRSTCDSSSEWVYQGPGNQVSQLSEKMEVKSFPKISLVVFLLAHLCLLLSRLTSLVIFAYVFRYHVFIIVGLHWLLVFTAICVGKKFDQSTKIISITKNGNKTDIRDRIKFTLILNASLRAYPMVFCLSSSIAKISFRKKISENFRAFVFVFYGILLMENAVMVLLANHSEVPHINILMKIALPLVFVGFISGALLLVLYYRCYHPAKINTENIFESTATNLDKQGCMYLERK